MCRSNNCHFNYELLGPAMAPAISRDVGPTYCQEKWRVLNVFKMCLFAALHNEELNCKWLLLSTRLDIPCTHQYGLPIHQRGPCNWRLWHALGK